MYVTFPHFGHAIDGKKYALNACYLILHRTYEKYVYLLPYLEEKDAESFKKWIHKEKYFLESEVEVEAGVQTLIKLIHCNSNGKPILLLINNCLIVFVQRPSSIKCLKLFSKK